MLDCGYAQHDRITKYVNSRRATGYAKPTS